MASIHPSVCVPISQPAGMPEEAIKSSAPCAGGKTGVSRYVWVRSTILKIKDADLRVAGTRNYSSIARVGHELDTEDVGMVSRADTCIERKRFGQIGGIVFPDVQVGVIGTRGQEVTVLRPTASIVSTL